MIVLHTYIYTSTIKVKRGEWSRVEKEAEDVRVRKESGV